MLNLYEIVVFVEKNYYKRAGCYSQVLSSQKTSGFFFQNIGVLRSKHPCFSTKTQVFFRPFSSASFPIVFMLDFWGEALENSILFPIFVRRRISGWGSVGFPFKQLLWNTNNNL